MKRAEEMRQLAERSKREEEVELLRREQLAQESNRKVVESQIDWLEARIAARALEGHTMMLCSIQTKDPNFPIGSILETLRSNGYTFSLNYMGSCYTLSIRWINGTN